METILQKTALEYYH